MRDLTQVTVMVPVYQHYEYVEQCLCSILAQKTVFQYQILVHDDASTDGSTEIIRRYSMRYPDRITVIYEMQNQYSQGRSIVQDILLPLAKGKYIAFCEGDDRWCDEYKLQRQYDYMESHPECTLCTHNTYWRETGHPEKNRMFNKWSQIHRLTQEEIFLQWPVHASSYFLRKEAAELPVLMKHYWMGDYTVLTWAASQSEIVSLPEAMSVYHAGNPNGVTWKNTRSGPETELQKERQRIEYLQLFDRCTGGRYHRIILKRQRMYARWERSLRAPFFGIFTKEHFLWYNTLVIHP